MTPAPWVRIAAAFLYLAFISFMFCLPGAALPQRDWFAKVYFDKWVHVGFFAVLLLLWLWALLPEKKGRIRLILVAAAYGITVEIVQDRFIPNRSFDLGDWVADMTGSFLGLWFWNRYIKK